jgi:hypothetical protein
MRTNRVVPGTLRLRAVAEEPGTGYHHSPRVAGGLTIGCLRI